MFLDLTRHDLLILEKQRLERFCSFFSDSLPFCLLHLDQQNELKIHCSEPWLVDLLLHELEHLCWYGWVVVGADKLSIYYAEEEIYTVRTRSSTLRSSSTQDFPVAS